MNAPSREDILHMARIAEQAERYDDMVQHMKDAITKGNELSLEERNLLSVAFKNMVGGRRSAWRIISTIEQKGSDSTIKYPDLAKNYRLAVEEEIKSVCADLLSVLDKHLIPNVSDPETKVFLYKMKGDYYRYLAEFALGEERKRVAENSLTSYKQATDVATAKLPPTHPVRLGLALNSSVFYYEILNNPEKACVMAKTAFDQAVAELDSLDEECYKDATLILQLLRDNLALWTTDAEGSGEAEPPTTQETGQGDGDVEGGES